MTRTDRIVQPTDYNIIKRMADSAITEDISSEFGWSGSFTVGTSGPLWEYKSHVNNSDTDELIGLQIGCASAHTGGEAFASILPPSLIDDTDNKLVNSIRRVVAWNGAEEGGTILLHWLGLVPRGYELVVGFTNATVIRKLLHGESGGRDITITFSDTAHAPPPMVTIYK